MIQELVVNGKLVDRAPLFIKPHPGSPIGLDDVFDVHTDGRRHPSEAVGHQGDQGAIAQIDGCLCGDAFQQVFSFVGGQDRRFAALDVVGWASD